VVRGRNVLDPQHRQGLNDDQKRERVEEETRVHRLRFAVAPFPEGGQRHAEGERTEHARDVELNRIERDGVRQIFLVDERWNQRLVRRSAERLGAAGDERQRQHVPDLDDAQKHQQREGGRGRHLHDLRHQQRAATVVAIGEHAADQ
jgi:hypothetical protein